MLNIELARGSAPSTPGRRHGACRAGSDPSRRSVAGPRAPTGRVMGAGRPRRPGAHHRRALPAGSRAGHPLCDQLRRPVAADGRPGNSNRWRRIAGTMCGVSSARMIAAAVGVGACATNADVRGLLFGGWRG